MCIDVLILSDNDVTMVCRVNHAMSWTLMKPHMQVNLPLPFCYNVQSLFFFLVVAVNPCIRLLMLISVLSNFVLLVTSHFTFNIKFIDSYHYFSDNSFWLTFVDLDQCSIRVAGLQLFPC